MDKKTTTILGIILVAVIAIIGFIGISTTQNTKAISDTTILQKYSSKNPQIVLNKAINQNKPIIDVFYTNKTNEQSLKTLKEFVIANQENYSYEYIFVNIDTMPQKDIYLKRFGINKAPTIQVRNGNSVLYQKDNFNKTLSKQELQNVLAGLNPKTRNPIQ